MSIGSAIVARWNACGFNTSIAPIRLGDPRNPSVKPQQQTLTTGAAPEGEVLPRAEYVLLDSQLEASTSGCSKYEQPFFIYIRRNKNEAVQLTEDLKAIRLKFHNSTNSPTNPFHMGVQPGDEKAISVTFVGSQYYPQHPNVVEGEIAFGVKFTIENTVPTS